MAYDENIFTKNNPGVLLPKNNAQTICPHSRSLRSSDFLPPWASSV